MASARDLASIVLRHTQLPHSPRQSVPEVSTWLRKPLTCSEKEELARLAEEKGLLFCVTYAYSQYPAVKQAQMMIKNGEIGDIQVVVAEYPQGWMATPVEQEGNKQAAWRTDPEKSGISNCVGDIGTHIENTVSYITGLEIAELCARLDIFGAEGRTLDTNAHILVKYKNGAVGSYWCSRGGWL